MESRNKKLNDCLLMYQFNKELPMKTEIHCFWCCHSFTNRPCVLPYKYIKNTFHIYGCFCSPECAAAYNFSENCLQNDMYERYSLLNLLYSRLYDENVQINLAPPRNLLRIFGGELNIHEYRSLNQNYRKQYVLKLPPMISFVPEISTVNTNRDRNKKKFIPLDVSKVNKARENLRLKRKQPMKNRNTLESCMNLKYL